MLLIREMLTHAQLLERSSLAQKIPHLLLSLIVKFGMFRIIVVCFNVFECNFKKYLVSFRLFWLNSQCKFGNR